MPEFDVARTLSVALIDFLLAGLHKSGLEDTGTETGRRGPMTSNGTACRLKEALTLFECQGLCELRFELPCPEL